jgi:hypothetical protein
VIDATTGQVAPGQALTEGEISNKMLQHLETVVLLHPSDEQLQQMKAVLSELGTPTFLDGKDAVVNPPGVQAPGDRTV